MTYKQDKFFSESDGLTKDEVKVCNCANCQRLLLGKSMQEYAKEELEQAWGDKLPPFVYKRIDDRPYCKLCHKTPREVPQQRYSAYGLPRETSYQRRQRMIEAFKRML